MKKADKSGTALAVRKKKASKLIVLVFEPEGGAPYEVEVEPEDGTFQLPGKSLSYRITRGSVYVSGGLPRTCINSGNPQTVNIHTLTGSDILHPSVYDGDINNNLAVQVTKAAKTRPVWARGTTWAIGALGLVVAALLFWQIKVLGSGLEGIQDAFENFRVTVQGSGGSEGQHQQIAPGGQ